MVVFKLMFPKKVLTQCKVHLAQWRKQRRIAEIAGILRRRFRRTVVQREGKVVGITAGATTTAGRGGSLGGGRSDDRRGHPER